MTTVSVTASVTLGISFLAALIRHNQVKATAVRKDLAGRVMGTLCTGTTPKKASKYFM